MIYFHIRLTEVFRTILLSVCSSDQLIGGLWEWCSECRANTRTHTLTLSCSPFSCTAVLMWCCCIPVCVTGCRAVGFLEFFRPILMKYRPSIAAWSNIIFTIGSSHTHTHTHTHTCSFVELFNFIYFVSIYVHRSHVFILQGPTACPLSHILRPFLVFWL